MTNVYGTFHQETKYTEGKTMTADTKFNLHEDFFNLDQDEAQQYDELLTKRGEVNLVEVDYNGYTYYYFKDNRHLVRIPADLSEDEQVEFLSNLARELVYDKSIRMVNLRLAIITLMAIRLRISEKFNQFHAA